MQALCVECFCSAASSSCVCVCVCVCVHMCCCPLVSSVAICCTVPSACLLPLPSAIHSAFATCHPLFTVSGHLPCVVRCGFTFFLSQTPLCFLYVFLLERGGRECLCVHMCCCPLIKSLSSWLVPFGCHLSLAFALYSLGS